MWLKVSSIATQPAAPVADHSKIGVDAQVQR